LKLKLKNNERLWAYAQIAVGCVLGGAAYPLFMTPNNIAPGGLTGVGVILNYLFKWPVGTVSLILNVPLFIIGYRSIGGVFAFRSLIATVLFSVFIDILPLSPMTYDPLLGTLFGGVLLGIGLGLILRGGATTGGSDMVARMVHRRLPFITVGSFLFGVDFMVVIAAGFVVGVTQALYALINIYIASRVVDAVMIGFGGNKACFIISDAWEKISRRVMGEMDRGVTLLSAKGAYTGNERPVVLCVLARHEVMTIKQIVRQVDESAFMFVTEAHEAIGEGFAGLNDEN
jgi:uncharacterized membrane-anchored protein YitT (DUF2179 family)